jgi:hypothetical protein
MADDMDIVPHPNSEMEDSEMISQENSWQVISSYFEAKGLVRQQLVRSVLPHLCRAVLLQQPACCEISARAACSSALDGAHACQAYGVASCLQSAHAR